eukprot:TRINITY_DN7986_c0_g1_i1.p1 TRINITY_DN7986_c0_g1~~TRINITY_DN7986_c0_g1_i1.p1  ORF type:complete len:128 (-),score=27.10 TRINITY_DN7986_c0_g1_i1:698-1081(-)
MGCGSGQNASQRVEAPQPAHLNHHEGEEERHEEHLKRAFALPDTGSVEIISMRYLIKYNPKEEQLESFTVPNECIVSLLTWESTEDSIVFTLKDKYAENVGTNERVKLPECPYQWRTTRDGHFVRER